MQNVRRQNLDSRDLAFLAIALIVHAGLLFLPLKAWQATRTQPENRLTVRLDPFLRSPRPEKQDMPEIVPNTPAPASPRVDPKKPAIPFTLEEIPTPPDSELESVSDTNSQSPPGPTLTARQLFELANQTELDSTPSKSGRQLGSAVPYLPPENWNRSAGAAYFSEFENTFNGMTVPFEVEIVDRWLAADGSHNVVLNLPNGDSVCGRAAAYNPMQPLVEPIMMFSPCGGGGKRTFSMPDRFNKGQ